MAYVPSVQSTTRLATTSTVAANLGATLFIAAGFFTKFRTLNYSTMQEIRDDSAISSNGNIYQAALTFFGQTGAAVPFYIGRRDADDVTFTPTTVTNSAEYTFELEVYDTTTLVGTDYTISITSDASATAAEISSALQTEIVTTQAIPNLGSVDNTGSITLTPDAGYGFVITNTSSNLTETYATTETAADVFAAVMEEVEQDTYFITSEAHDETFVLAMADEVQATSASDWPKQYHFSTSDANSIVPLVDPAVDLLGKVKAGNYSLTSGTWSHEDDIFPELAILAVNGAIQPGAAAFKFVQLNGIEAARHPVTDKVLTTAAQGYIKDRNASWNGIERGVTFTHGGTMANGEWIDVIRAAHWINDQIEVRILNLFLNTVSAGGKISFRDSDKQKVLNTIDGVLSEAVTRNILTGYVPAYLEVEPSFADQTARTLDDVKFTGYLSGAIYFAIVDGFLTYSDSTLA